MKKSVSERLEQARINLIRTKPFFGYSVPRLTFKEVPEKQCSTAGVDYRGNVFYSNKFIDELNDEQLLGVTCHELMHFVLGHHIRGEKFAYHNIANIAQDILINDILINLEGMQVIPCTDVWDFTIFSPNKKKKQRDDDEGKGFYANPKTGKFTVITPKGKKISIDVRGQCWEYIYDCLLNIISRDDMQEMISKLPASASGDGLPFLGDSFDSHEWAPNGMSDTEKQALEDQAKDMFVDAKTFDDKKKSRSPDGSSWLDRMVNDKLKPQINWKSELKRVIQAAEPYDYTFMKPNKRSYSVGAYLPSVLKEAFHVTLAMDVSGSISDKEFAMFIAEFKGIIMSKSNVKVRTLYWSTKVDKHNDKVFKRSSINSLSNELPTISTTGGTEISCVKEYLAKHSTERDKKNLDTIIYLTDGYIEDEPDFWPSKNKVFVLTATGSDEIVKKHGKVIRLNDRD